jgi:hypothetical protein
MAQGDICRLADHTVSTGPPAASRLSHAVVGGVDYTIGGWGAYEVDRRRARWEASGGASPARERYPARTYVSAGDVVASILSDSRKTLGGGGGAESALQKAARRLSQSLGRLEDKLCSPDEDGVWECVSPTTVKEPPTGHKEPPTGHKERLVPYPTVLLTTVPALTSADLRAFAADPSQETDPEAIAELGEDVIALSAALGLALSDMPPIFNKTGLPPLPSRTVPVTDDEAILRLEDAVTPYVASIEEAQAALAARLDTAAAALDRILRTGR